MTEAEGLLVDELVARVSELRGENEKLRDALSVYANYNNWIDGQTFGGPGEVKLKGWEIAMKALEK